MASKSPTARTLELTLPLPPKSLNAHASGSWRGKTADVKRCRELAVNEAIAWIRRNDCGELFFARGLLSLDFHYPDLRRRDLLNTAQMCKAYIDGAVVDSLVMTDDDWQHMRIGQITPHLDRANPRVVLTLADLDEKGTA